MSEWYDNPVLIGLLTLLASTVPSYFISKMTAKDQYAKDITLQKERYREESDLELREHEMDLKNELKSRRDELFLEKGIAQDLIRRVPET